MGTRTATPISSGSSARAVVIWMVLAASFAGLGLMLAMRPLFGQGETQVGVDKKSTPTTMGSEYKANEFVQQASFSIDHSIMNNPNLLPEPNPSPMAVAAYN